jgi:hypothetical protein
VKSKCSEHYQHIYSTCLLFREAGIKDLASMNIINIARVCYLERLTSRTHPTAASMNTVSRYNTCLLFREADIEDPPNNSVHEHYQHSRDLLFREADIEVPPDYRVHEYYQGERFRKIKESILQSCRTDNQMEMLTSGTHGSEHRLLHRGT